MAYDPTDITNLEGLAPLDQEPGGTVGARWSPETDPRTYLQQQRDANTVLSGGGASGGIPAPSRGPQGVPDEDMYQGAQNAKHTWGDESNVVPGKVPMFKPGDTSGIDTPFYVPGNDVKRYTDAGGELAVPFKGEDGVTKWSRVSTLNNNLDAFRAKGYQIDPELNEASTNLSRFLPGATLGAADVAAPANQALMDYLSAPKDDKRTYWDFWDKRRSEQQALNYQRETINPKNYTAGSAEGGVIPAFLTGGGGVGVQAAKQGLSSAFQSAMTSIAQGDPWSTVGEKTVAGGTTGAAAAPLAQFGGGLVKETAATLVPHIAQQEVEAQIISRYAQDNKMSFEDAAAALNKEGKLTAQGMPSNAEPDLAVLHPDNPTITSLTQVADKQPSTGIQAQRLRNEQAVADNIRNMAAPSVSGIDDAEAAAKKMSDANYSAFRQTGVPTAPPAGNVPVAAGGMPMGPMQPKEQALYDAVTSITGDPARGMPADPNFAAAVNSAREKSFGADMSTPQGHAAFLQNLTNQIDKQIEENKPVYQMGTKIKPGDADAVRLLAEKNTPLKAALIDMSPQYATAQGVHRENSQTLEEMRAARDVAAQSVGPQGQVTAAGVNKAMGKADVPEGWNSPRAGMPALTPADQDTMNTQLKYLDNLAQAERTGRGTGPQTFKLGALHMLDVIPAQWRAAIGTIAGNALAFGGATPAAFTVAAGTGALQLHSTMMHKALNALLNNDTDQFGQIADQFSSGERATFARTLSDSVRNVMNSSQRAAANAPVMNKQGQPTDQSNAQLWQDELRGLWPSQ